MGSVRFICSACSGTGHSRYHENRDCDQCDGHGTILSRLTLGTGDRCSKWIQGRQCGNFPMPDSKRCALHGAGAGVPA